MFIILTLILKNLGKKYCSTCFFDSSKGFIPDKVVGARPHRRWFSNTEGNEGGAGWVWRVGWGGQTNSERLKHHSGDNLSLLTGHTEQQDTLGLVENQTAEALGWFSDAFLENTPKNKK